MKAFIIFNESSLKDDKIVSLISAFADIESLGVSEDLLGSVDRVRQTYPDAAIFDVRVLDQEPDLLIPLLTGRKSPLIILPENYQIRERCTYVGVDFSSVDRNCLEWLVRSMKRMIRECHRQGTV